METEILHFTTSQEEGLGEEGFGQERREGREGWTGVSVCARTGRVRHGKWGYAVVTWVCIGILLRVIELGSRTNREPPWECRGRLR